MLPLILVGAGTVLLAGCSTQKRVASAPKPRPQGEPKPSHQPDFGKDDRAFSIYQKLKKLGVEDRKIDLGCPRIKYLKDGSWAPSITGKSDGKISSCEVYEFSLNHPRRYPDLTALLTGKPIPWALEEGPRTPAALKPYLKKIRKAIRFTEELLNKKGWKPNTLEYQERMAVAMHYLVSVPDKNMMDGNTRLLAKLRAKPNKNDYEVNYLRENEKIHKRAIAYISKLDKNLERLGILEFREFHHKHGGLYITGDYTREYSAQDALLNHQGECTEKSKILYAILQKVNITPSFILVDPQQSTDPSLQDLIRNNPNYFHIALDLKLGNRTLILDPSVLSIDPNHGSYLPLTMRQYLGLDFVGQAENYRGEKNPKKELEFYKKSLQVDPTSFFAYNNRANLWDEMGFKYWEKGDFKSAQKYYLLAIADYNQAIEINPFFGHFYSARGSTWLKLQQPDKALPDLNKAIQLAPSFPDSYLKRGVIYLMKNKVGRGAEDFVSYLRLYPDKGAQNVFSVMRDYYRSRSFKPSLVRQVELETELDLIGAHAQVTLSIMLWKAGHQQMARKKFKIVFDELKRSIKALAEAKETFSPPTQDFIKDIFSRLPGDMKVDPAFKQWKKELEIH